MAEAHVEPRLATDNSNPLNCSFAVYATERRDIAIGMSLRDREGNPSFGNYSEEPFVHVFLKGEPADTPYYLYTLPSDSFEPAGPYQWASPLVVPIASIEQFTKEELAQYWREATPEEREEFEKRTGRKL